MLGSNNSIFDNPSLLQRIIKKKSSSSNTAKTSIRPLYTADIVTEVGPWKKQLNAAQKRMSTYSFNKTKTYNHPSIRHQFIPSRPAPSLSPSISSNTATSIADSAIVFPTLSTSTPALSKRKRPLSSEILIKIMDQRILKMKQQQLDTSEQNLQRSVSTSTTHSIKATHNLPRLNKVTGSNAVKINNSIRQQSNTNHNNEKSKKLKTSKSGGVLNKLHHHHANQQHELLAQWPYVLTQNNDEQDRSVAQHYLLRTAFGSDFQSPIQSQLQKGIVVLDVGCGNGVWTMEMSTAFPKSTFIGIDQSSEFYPKDIKPRNCHFRSCGPLVQHRVSLPFPDNSIDFIYQRDVNWGLTGQTWQPLLHEYQRILKPGGWLEFVEPDLETQNSLETECAINDKLIAGLSLRQQDPYLVHRLPTMLSIFGFQGVEDCTQSFPLGWGLSHSHSTTTTTTAATNTTYSTQSIEEEDEDEQLFSTEYASTCSTRNPSQEIHRNLDCSEFARAMASQYLCLLTSLRPWLSTVMNLSHAKYDDYIAGLPAEWSRAHTFVNWHAIIAQKPLY